VIGAENLEGGERQVLFDLGGKECQRPATGPEVVPIADILRSKPYQFQYRRRCASDNAGEMTDVKNGKTYQPREFFTSDLFLGPILAVWNSDGLFGRFRISCV
jgi:hypothetical protein